MRKTAASAFIGVIAAIMLVFGGIAPAQAASTPPGAAGDILRALNRGLIWDSTLAAVAQAHANTMTGADHSGYTRAGWATGENVAWAPDGNLDAWDIVAAWDASPKHHAIQRNSLYTYAGAGVGDTGGWVLILGAPAPAPSPEPAPAPAPPKPTVAPPAQNVDEPLTQAPVPGSSSPSNPPSSQTGTPQHQAPQHQPPSGIAPGGTGAAALPSSSTSSTSQKAASNTSSASTSTRSAASSPTGVQPSPTAIAKAAEVLSTLAPELSENLSTEELAEVQEAYAALSPAERAMVDVDDLASAASSGDTAELVANVQAKKATQDTSTGIGGFLVALLAGVILVPFRKLGVVSKLIG